ncbi:MAG: DUF1501 domain-containing protein [Chthoniobacteraceae bacterium]
MASIFRRDFLRYSALTAAGLLTGPRFGFSPAAAAATAPAAQLAQAKAKAVIQIWLWGGPSHLDTFDPKPEAGQDYSGPLKAIPTNLDGLQLCELLPQLAKLADKYSILHSLTHGNNGHETAAYMVQTGHADGDRLVYPSMGAVVSLLRGYETGYKGLLPPYIVLTQPQGRFSEAGFLGSRYKPFATGGDPARPVFAVQGIVAEGISTRRQEERRNLLHQLDTLGRSMPPGDSVVAEFRQTEEEAYDMILGEGAKIFDLSQEGPAMREWYGNHTFGQSCLAARRLVERGVRYVTINCNGWDTHKQNFPTMRNKVPQLDSGVAALLVDLESRGLLDSTIVWVCGEFGRTPKVQWEAPWNGGRGHWGNVFSALIAGGGFKGGHVVGASDAKGQEVKDRPIYPWDLLASMYTQLGIDPNGLFPRMDGEVRITQPVAGAVKSGGMLKEIM